MDAMTVLGNGLKSARRYEDALSVRKAELAMKRRVGASEGRILIVQTNLANSYHALGRYEEALRMMRDVYSGRLKLDGEEHESTLASASNCAGCLSSLQRFEEARSLMRKAVPVARRVLGDNDRLTLRMRKVFARALYEDAGATLDDLREAVAMLSSRVRFHF